MEMNIRRAKLWLGWHWTTYVDGLRDESGWALTKGLAEAAARLSAAERWGGLL